MTPGRSSRAFRVAALALTSAVLLGACSISGAPTFPPVGSSPGTAGDATAGARAQVTAALTVEGLTVQDPKTAYRPPEGAIFAAAPRTVLQAVLPDDPSHGYVVLYAFGTPQQALTGAQDQAAYIASGPGRVLFVPGTQFSLRVLGNIAIFFAWSPDSSPDSRTPSIALALSQIGDEVPIPA
jgi:hypothetical protein